MVQGMIAELEGLFRARGLRVTMRYIAEAGTVLTFAASKADLVAVRDILRAGGRPCSRPAAPGGSPVWAMVWTAAPVEATR